MTGERELKRRARHGSADAQTYLVAVLVGKDKYHHAAYWVTVVACAGSGLGLSKSSWGAQECGITPTRPPHR